MGREIIELTSSSGSKPMTRLLTALACLGEDDEIELILPHDLDAFHAVLKEEDCSCERLNDKDGRCILLVRRRP